METQQIRIGSTIQVINSGGQHGIATGSVGTVNNVYNGAYGVMLHSQSDVKYFWPSEIKLLVGDYETKTPITNPEPRTYTEEEVKVLAERAWDAGYDCHYADCNTYTPQFGDFESFWNANKPQ